MLQCVCTAVAGTSKFILWTVLASYVHCLLCVRECTTAWFMWVTFHSCVLRSLVSLIGPIDCQRLPNCNCMAPSKAARVYFRVLVSKFLVPVISRDEEFAEVAFVWAHHYLLGAHIGADSEIVIVDRGLMVDLPWINHAEKVINHVLWLIDVLGANGKWHTTERKQL